MSSTIISIISRLNFEEEFDKLIPKSVETIILNSGLRNCSATD